ncbi:MAG: twitching motility protein PilT [Dehalococcoidia bacterium]|nr:twitching motility protein PilT [Dehalococcoidia bacterium]
MTSLVLDEGAFVAVERNDRVTVARLLAGRSQGFELRTSAIVIAQVWREPTGRHARLARLLRTVNVRPVTEDVGRAAGILLGRAGSSDAVDATVVLLAEDGDRILTSDPSDLSRLAAAAGRRVDVVPC